jgi:hypothetical protein
MTRPAARPLTERQRLRLAWGGLLALWVMLGLLFGPRYFRQVADAQVYGPAPVCPAPAPRSAVVATECRLVLPARLTQRYARKAGRGLRHFVEVRLPDGTTRNGQLPERDAWHRLGHERPLTVELWRDRLMRVEQDGRTHPTSDNPEWDASNIAGGTTAIAVMAGGMALILALATRRVRRREENRQGPAS